MNPAARQVALLNAQAAAWDAAAAGGSGAGRRHHRRHSGGGAAAAGGRPPAERRGGAAGPGHRTCPSDAWADAGRCAIRRPASPGCCTGWARRGAMSVRGRRRRPMRLSRHAARRCRSALLPAERAGRMAERGAGGDRRPVAAVAPPISRRKPPRSPWCCARRWKRRARTAALVTPDRDLAGRVATELLRYGVVADDSAGETLGRDAAGRVPPPAGPRRGRGTGAGAAAGAAEASAGGGRPVARRLPRGRARAGTGLSARPAPERRA